MTTDRLFRESPAGKLFLRLALPGIGSAAMASLYLVVDGILVGRYLGSDALAAINLAMPFLIISFMIADMIGMGSAVQIAISLGRKDRMMANRIFTFALTLIGAVAGFTGMMLWLSAPDLLSVIGAEGLLAEMALACLTMFSLFALLVMPFFAVDNYLRLCGHPRWSFAINMGSAVLNLGLDWLFLEGFGWGIWSVVMATCISFSAGTIIGFIPFLMGRMPVRLSGEKLPLSYIWTIGKCGAGEFVSNVSDSFFQMTVNAVLLQFAGASYVVVFSLIMYIDAMALSLLRSLSDAAQPVISYCLGARDWKRIRAMETCVLGTGAVLGLGIFAVMQTSGELLVELFLGKGEEEIHAIAIPAMEIFSFSYLILWLGMGLGDYFTALSRPLPALIQSACQIFFFPIICLVVLMPYTGADSVWPAAVAGRTLAAGLAVSLFFLYGRMKA